MSDKSESPWTWESLIIAALVRRLGGSVHLDLEELRPRGGVIITPENQDIKIIAGE